MARTQCWTGGHLRLFISHLARHKTLASQVADSLLPYGVSGFVAHQTIEPTQEWLEVIEFALRTADAMAVILTPKIKESSWVDQEVGYCLGRRRLVIPISRGVTPYGFLGKFQAAQGARKTPQQIAESIVSILAKHELTARKMAVALVGVFEKSSSFSDARANMTKLERITYMDRTLETRLKAAAAENSQIREAYGVPRRLTALLRQHRASVDLGAVAR
jgi:hypothetical protein